MTIIRILGYKGDNYYFTRDRNITYYNADSYSSSILAVLSVYGIPLPKSMLQYMASAVMEKTIKADFSYSCFSETLERLLKAEIIASKKNISFCHDSSKEIILEYLMGNGDYIEIADALASCLRESDGFESDHACDILRLYTNSSPYDGFLYYKELPEIIQKRTDVIKLASQCIIKSFLSLNIDEIEWYGIHLFLTALYKNACLNDANNLGSVLIRRLKNLSPEARYELLSLYTKALIDLGKFDGVHSANNTYNELKRVFSNDDQKQFEVYLIGMMLYEHQGDTVRIQQCYESIEKIVKSTPLTAQQRARFYRNKGLVLFHADLKDDYDLAIELAIKSGEKTENALLLGTCYNNRGLASFYSGNISEAKLFFGKAQDCLRQSGYEILRPINNLASCEIVCGNYDKANILLCEGLKDPFEGPFEIASANLNLALVLFETGDTDGAERILKKYISEYYDGEKKLDGWIYANALLNQAYIYSMTGNYENAEKMYRDSTFYSSRFNPEAEKERRIKLSNQCGKRELFIKNHSERFDFFKTPYILSLLAYYII